MVAAILSIVFILRQNSLCPLLPSTPTLCFAPTTQFYLQNKYMVAAILSIVFILWHYAILAALLTYFTRSLLLDLIKPDEETVLLAKAKAKGKRGASSW